MNRTIIEPACGGGNLIHALLVLGHDPARITAFDLDPAWGEYTRGRCGVTVVAGNFLNVTRTADVVVTNPPFEGDMHAQFVDHALQLAPLVIAVLPTSIEYGEERDRKLWAQKARIVRRAKLPVRVKYGGDGSASFDSEALMIERRYAPRVPGEINAVIEEVWREKEGA